MENDILAAMFQKMTNALDAVLRFVKTVSLFVFLAAGIAVIGSSVGFALIVPLKIPAVIFSSVGSILGTAIVCLILPKLTATKLESEKAKTEDELRSKIELETKVRQAEHLKMEVGNKDREIERLRSMAISVEGFQGILKLALLQIDAALKDFSRIELHRETPKGIMRGEIHEYIGLLESRFKANLGVDLQKLRVREDGAGGILISGIQSEFQGFAQLQEDWKLKEVRVKKEGGLLPDSYSVLQNDARLTDQTIEQRRLLLERINNGAEFRNFDSALKGLAKEVIKVLMTPLGKRLIFEEKEVGGGVPLLDFIRQNDRSIEDRIIEIESAKQKLIASKT